MASTTFIDFNQNTPIVASWLNDVNNSVYNAIGANGVAPTTPAQVIANLGLSALQGAPLAITNEGPFVSGTNFTAGTTTSLTLSQTYGTNNKVTVYFDAMYQGYDTFSLSGTVITFNAPIPLGTSKVYIQGSLPTSPTGGSVSSVGLVLPSIFTVTGSPITTSGSLTATFSTQAANTFLAAPSGTSGSPSMRTILPADLPVMSATVAGIVPTPPNNSQAFLNGTGVFSVPTTPSTYSVNVSQFPGADPTGVTDSSGAFAAAFASLGVLGGTVVYSQGKYLIANNLTVPSSCTLHGPVNQSGTQFTNSSSLIGQMAAIMVAPTATITLMGGSGIYGCLIYRQGMIFPAPSPASFAGVAITTGADDTFVYNSFILGFNKAVFSSGWQRLRCDKVNFDCNNGIEVTACYDIARITNCHGWPFSTIASGVTDTTIQRSGVAYYFHDVADWSMLDGCFATGYLTGIQLTNVNNMTVRACEFDNTNAANTDTHAGSVGILVSGTSIGSSLNDCLCAAQAKAGINVNTSTGFGTNISNYQCWGGSTHGVLVDGGDVNITGGMVGNSLGSITYGVSCSNATSRVFINGVRFHNIVTNPVNPAVATTLIHIGSNNDFGDTADGTNVAGVNLGLINIASAGTINLPCSGDVFNITGVTGITHINGGWAGRKITLLFGGICTVTHSTGAYSDVSLAGNANWTSVGGSGLTIAHNGGQWYETSHDNSSGQVYPGSGIANSTGAAWGASYGVSGSGSVALTTGATLSQPLIVGVTTSSNATAGNVGEYVSSTIVQGSAVALTNATTTNVASITLTAGDWDVSANLQYLFGASTTFLTLISGVSSTSATFAGNDTFTQFSANTNQAPNSGLLVITQPTPIVRYSLASTTTIYMLAFSNFATSTLSAYGTIRARRIR